MHQNHKINFTVKINNFHTLFILIRVIPRTATCGRKTMKLLKQLIVDPVITLIVLMQVQRCT